MTTIKQFKYLIEREKASNKIGVFRCIKNPPCSMQCDDCKSYYQKELDKLISKK